LSKFLIPKEEKMVKKDSLSRREFLQVGSLGLGAAILAACSGQTTPSPTATAVTTEAGPAPTAVPDEPRAIVGDVLDFSLDGDWPGRFGRVRFRLQEGLYDSEKAYFIRTDASDPDFAEENGMVSVVLLRAAENVPDAASSIYLFRNSSPEQLPILDSVPSEENYSPVHRIYWVESDGSTVFDSAESLRAAESSGDVSVETSDIFVNYPVVKWPGGEMSVDQEKLEYLGGGQLLEPVDTENMTVTFKLHECFPGSRYIVTDTSAAPMAPMMAVSPSGPLQALKEQEFSGTDKIWVFANGIEGSGVMGFQPAIFAHRAGDPVWSPLWDHFTLRWTDGTTPRVLKSGEDVNAALETGEVELFNGTPDTHPNGFIVNCPVPVLAPNTFSG
jgi:hypothetical protein